MAFLEWLQQLPYSIWMNESSSLWAFPMFLFLHTLGMSIVAGGSAAIDFALLGLWPRDSLKSLKNIFPVLMVGFAVNAFTGVSIFMKDAATYGINMDLYIKLLFVLAGMVLLVVIRRRVFDNPEIDRVALPRNARVLAWASLACWTGAIIAGRLIAYVGPVPGL
jgi:hypothetical protein